MPVKTKILMMICFFILCPLFAFAGEINLPKTGQTTCYDGDGNVIDCAGTGQDGDMQAGVAWPELRFNDNGDGTITDNLTGLIWLKNAGAAETMTWNQALEFCNNLASGSAGLTDASTAGDWRLPNIVELESLVNAEESHSETWLNTQGFTNVQSSYYWSATNLAAFPDSTGSVLMETGKLAISDKSNYNYVWPVRAEQPGYAKTWQTGQKTSYSTGDDGDLEKGVAWPSPRFTDNFDGTVTDNLTGLIWFKNTNPAETMTWTQALEFCKNLSSGSYSLTDGSSKGDWRLPNRKELFSLVDSSQYNPSLPQDNPFDNVQSSFYWSATTFAGSKDRAWYVNIYISGFMGSLNKSNISCVWPVRAGQTGQSAETGSLKVTISPAGAVAADAQWRVDGDSWQDSEVTLSGLTVGSHTVYFSSISGWDTPGSQPVTINNGEITSTSAVYMDETVSNGDDLPGIWEVNSLASGPGAPWWMRGLLTITSDGSFSGTLEEYNSDPDNVSGVFSISSSGVLSSNDIDPDFRAVMDAGKTVIVGTGTWDEWEAGTTEIITLLKKAESYSTGDMAGTWEVNSLASGSGAPWWERGELNVNTDGSFSATTIESDGTTGNPSGTLNISGDGIITIVGSSTARGCMDSGKTVMVFTDTWSNGNPGTTEIKVMTKKEGTYSQADLTGAWEVNGLASGSGAPWWMRGEINVGTGGSFSGTLEEYQSDPDSWSGTFNISTDGIVTIVGNNNGQCAMDSGKTIIACTATWSWDLETTQILLMTKKVKSKVKSKAMPWIPLLLDD